MDEFIVEGYKRVVYEVKNIKDQINIIKEKLENKLKSKIEDIEIEINTLKSR
jgi:archaellum component FlaC